MLVLSREVTVGMGCSFGPLVGGRAQKDQSRRAMLDIAGTYQIKLGLRRAAWSLVALLGQAGRTAEERAELDWTEPDSPRPQGPERPRTSATRRHRLRQPVTDLGSMAIQGRPPRRHRAPLLSPQVPRGRELIWRQWAYALWSRSSRVPCATDLAAASAVAWRLRPLRPVPHGHKVLLVRTLSV